MGDNIIKEMATKKIFDSDEELSERIQALPPEIRQKILRYVNENIIMDRRPSWSKIHQMIMAKLPSTKVCVHSVECVSMLMYERE